MSALRILHRIRPSGIDSATRAGGSPVRRRIRAAGIDIKRRYQLHAIDAMMIVEHAFEDSFTEGARTLVFDDAAGEAGQYWRKALEPLSLIDRDRGIQCGGTEIRGI